MRSGGDSQVSFQRWKADADADAPGRHCGLKLAPWISSQNSLSPVFSPLPNPTPHTPSAPKPLGHLLLADPLG